MQNFYSLEEFIKRRDRIFFLAGAGVLFLFLAIWFGYPSLVEPIIINASSSTSSVVATLTVGEEITLTAPTAFSLLPNITLTNSSSSATGTWNVKTNSQNGYTFSLNATSSNALRDPSTSEYFNDCASSSPDVWNTRCASSTNFIFGFSAYGDAVPTGTWGTGSNCGSSGAPGATLKYQGFNNTTLIQVASSTTETSSGGTDTNMCLTATQGASIFAPNGTYQATIVGTATTQ